MQFVDWGELSGINFPVRHNITNYVSKSTLLYLVYALCTTPIPLIHKPIEQVDDMRW